MTLQLDVPAIAERPDPEVELRRVYLEEWVDALPYGSPPALVARLEDALRRFNRSPVKPALRLALLEYYLPPYAFLLDLHERRSSVRSAHALERHRSEADASRRLALALAEGYKVALLGSLERPSRFGRDRDDAHALQRSILLLAFALLHAYDEYLPPQPGLWRELYQLQAHGEAAGLLHRRVSGATPRADFGESAEVVLKRLFLVSLVDPYRLAIGEIARVHAALAALAPRARILPAAPIGAPAGHFVIDPRLDRRPQPWRAVRESLDPRCRILDANPVLEALQAQKSEPRRPRGDELSPALVATLSRALGLPPQRHGPRAEARGRVTLVAGLERVHRLLGGPRLDSRRGTGTTPGGIDLDYNHHEPMGAEGGPRGDTWELVDEGPGGVGLRRASRPEATLAAGDLVGMQFPQRGQTGQDWSVGAVRWLAIGKDGRYHLGVQRLGRTATPLHLAGPPARPALAIPDLVSGTGIRLITPVGSLKAGRPVEVIAPEGPGRLAPEMQLEDNRASFERWLCHATPSGP